MAAPKLNEPKVTIGNVPLMAQRFVWALTPGPLPYRMQVVIPNSMVEKINAVSNPTTIRLKVSGDIGLRDASCDVEFKKVYLTEPRRIDAFTWGFEIADLRVRWFGQKLTWTANRTWRLNEFGEGVAQEVDPNDPAALRQPFDRFAEFRYLPWSKNGEKPWTARELLILLLKELEHGNNPLIEGADNGVIVEQMQWIEEPAEKVLAELSSLARCHIGVLPEGRVHIYRSEEILSARNVIPLERPAIDGGVIYQQDLSRIRPREVVCRVSKRVETLIVGVPMDAHTSVPAASGEPLIGPTREAKQDEGKCAITEEDYKTGRAVVAYNVVQLPRDVEHNGVRYQRNTWMPMSIYLDAIGLSESLVRNSWFSNLFVFHHAVVNAGRGAGDPPDPVKMMEALAVKQHYRQTWQLDPYWVQRWESWDTTRASIIDPVTRYALPTQVWADFCVVPNVFMPNHAKGKRAYRKRAWNYLVDEEPPDGDGAKIDRTQTYTVAALEPKDQALGILHITYPPDLTTVITEIVPSGVDNLPVLSAAGDVLLWSDARLREKHTFEAVISVTPAVDDDDKPTDDRLFSVRVPSKNVSKAKGPRAELLVTEEVARYPHPAGLTGDDAAEALRTAELKLPSNLGVLVALAKVKSNILLHSFVDRLAGYATFPGVDDKRLKLFGPCRGIFLEFDESAGLRSHYDCSSPPPVPELITRLSPAERRYLYRQLEESK